ncbi:MULTISPECIES: serine hydroxymethyltransferase [Lactiplantibacillus]|jgi:glycine hydroxymethyltransferase|uniref:Serine hydroxymethyltransferase n=2 Tax=Lactiplantibacillus pentosus TaxID=1589 RepID=A0A2S9VPK9_LACPE|nr:MULTISPECIES: serine hydroxymethyltransferase [Lactiplantibacillus]CCC18539.1 serine hydroxymethyltransferase (SHMT) (serine methylase) [Lactiplantibacillus pentosus IG1]ASG80827.1 serine hydroxymethyltransferase [Lactiplantibacillus pentosus]AYG37879.1 serine hydroxymethyltransferase [Lactiplantibacillus pentosus]AYG40538.1 serine hydroxymethyltransferase [Lactiplantibacillus pentosus]MBO9165631.1 serine hydroxymethyltransferase [Lactiplantibacillus pentosus]
MNYQEQDPEVWAAISKEQARQQHNIELIASENIVSKGVRAAQGSVLTNKYSEGYPGHRFYGGNEYIDQVETLAIERAKKLFGAEYANVQPHSGSQANAAAYMALIQPGDRVMGMSLDAGGHLTHGSSVNFSGKLYDFQGYGLDPETEELNYDAILAQAQEFQPKLIVAGASAYSRLIDFKKFREIADAVGALLMVDMAHIAGLVAAGLHPNPVPYADVVTTTTHKTLRGPRGGMILAKEKYGKKINSAVFPGNQGGPLDHVIAGKAIALGEDLQPEFKVYAQHIIDNAKAMAKVFTESDLVRVISGGTDNHLMTIDVTKSGLNGRQVQDLLDTVYITVNKEAIPNETLGAFKTSGIRLGTPAITTRGFDEADAAKVAELILQALQAPTDQANLDDVKQQAMALTAKHPIDVD